MRMVLVFLCVAFVFGITNQIMAAIDLKTLEGLWLFDEKDTLKDLSGKGRDAKQFGNPKKVEGRFGKAIEFDGAGAYLEIPAHPNPTKAITITAWAKSTSATWNQHGWLVEKRDAYILHNVAGTKNMALCIMNGGGWNAPKSWDAGQVGPDDITKWHMYTGTFDSSTGKWRIYIDGEIRSEADINKAEIAPDNGPINIGNDTCCAGRFGAGVVDEVAIFNVALAPADVMEIYKKGFVMVQAVDTSGKLSTSWGRIKESL